MVSVIGRRALVVLGTGAAIALMIGALWTWQHGAAMVSEWRRPAIAAWGMDCAAVALGAAAQVMLLSLVVIRVYGRDVVIDLLAALVGLGCCIATVSALALGLAGR